jgi:transposase-like protein
MDALEWLRKHLEAEDNDLLREMVRSFAEGLMAAEMDVVCNAGYGEVTPDRTNSRNGYRSRTLDTRVGTIDLAVPRLREGSYHPGWLLEPRRRAERALVAVVAECYVRGVSTRRVEGLVHTLGIESLSKSQVSRMAQELDAEVAAFRARPLDGGPYTYISLDAMTQKVREHGRIVNVAVVIAVGVNAEGHREVLGFDVITTEDGAGWLAFLRGLVARGLAGTTLVISDAHVGLVDAVRSTLTGATWQRSSVHHPPWRSVTVEASATGGKVPPVTPRRWERALAA